MKSFRYWQWRTILVSMAVFSIFYVVRKNFSIVMPGLTAEYGISNTSLGAMIGIGSLIYGLSRFINGFLVERYSTKVYMGIGLILCAIANICIGFSLELSYWITGVHEGPQYINVLVLVLGITMVLNQYFQGFGFPPCARMLPQWIAPSELATKMSLWNTAHSIGSFIAVVLCGFIMTNMGADMSGDSSVLASIEGHLSSAIRGWDNLPAAQQTERILACASHYGAWRMCFFIPAGMAVMAAIVSFTVLKDTPQSVGLPEVEGTHIQTSQSGETSMSKAERRRFNLYMVFRNRWVWTLAIANVFVYILRMGVLDWGPKFLTEDRGMDIHSAAWSVAVFELSAIVGTIFAGWLSDKMFKGLSQRVCVLTMAGASVCLGIFALVPMSTLLSTIVLALSGFCIYGPQSLIGSGSANHATKEAAATANGLVGICGYVGSALSAFGVGLIADHWGWHWVFITFVTMGLIGALVFLTMWKAPRDGYQRSRELLTLTSEHDAK